MDFDRIDDMEYVKESLARLDKQFDLVLITEHFWEGIVLMKHMLCAEYEHLYQESTNVRKYEIEPLNAERQATFEEFHKTDTLMYDYFNASLHRKIEAFGHEVKQLCLYLVSQVIENLENERRNPKGKGHFY